MSVLGHRGKPRWVALRARLRTSLWVVPFLCTAFAAALAVSLLRLDHARGETSAWFLYGGQADGARELLATIASSMLTIAGLVFSITILVLQLASSQFSPRVLRSFLQDRMTQLAMGTFLGSFVYAMMLLPQVRSATPQSAEFVPGLSIYVAFLFALVSVALFVRYIHHMAHSVRAVNIIRRVARETHHSIERLYPEDLLVPTEQPAPIDLSAPDLVLENRRHGGVVSSVDEDALMEAALERDLIIAIVPRVGAFVPRGAPLCRIWGTRDRAGLDAESWITVSSERTPDQDAIFGFRQLVDIAERALSPGINDPTTATEALDHLHDLLRSLARRRIPAAQRADRDGRLRLVLPRPDWADYVALAFEEIRLYGAGSVQIVRRAREALEDLLTVVSTDRAPPLRRELALLDATAARVLPGLSR